MICGFYHGTAPTAVQKASVNPEANSKGVTSEVRKGLREEVAIKERYSHI